MSLARALALAYGTLTLLTLLVYAWDKWRAKRGGRRVPEKTLHGLALLGGFAGAWAGMSLFRHKTQKPVFTIVCALAALLHAGLWSWYFFA